MHAKVNIIVRIKLKKFNWILIDNSCENENDLGKQVHGCCAMQNCAKATLDI